MDQQNNEYMALTEGLWIKVVLLQVVSWKSKLAFTS